MSSGDKGLAYVLTCEAGSTMAADELLQSSLPHIWSPLVIFFEPHPQYYHLIDKCLTEIFYSQGPLKKPERHYIAIMTAASQRCDFLINLHQREFENEGGDPKWLQGLAQVDERRILMLDEFITYLSHRPWMVNADVIRRLCRGDQGEPLWSLNQLVHAAVIVATTNSLCTFCHGVGGVKPISVSSSEMASLAQRCEWLVRDRQFEQRPGQNREIDYLITRMKMLRQAAKEHENEDEIPEHSTAAFFSLANAPDENAGVDSHSSGNVYTQREQPFAYVDFNLRADPSKPFKIHEFSWDHGYHLIEDLYSTVAFILDDKFNLMQNLTYNTMGEYENVDTSEYRLAIWNYIQALFGIRHDDYGYAKVNQLLTRNMKAFVKTATCAPHTMSDAVRNVVMTEFDASEKIHVLLMIVEARMQASLLYFTRALTNYYVFLNKTTLSRC